MQYTCTYHDSRADCNGSTAVGVRYNIAVADRQECDGNEPHGIEQIRMLDIVVTAPTHRHTDTHKHTGHRYTALYNRRN